MLTLLLFAVLFLLVAGSVYPGDLAEAARLEKSGHADQALRLYQEWLDSNPPGTMWDTVLLRTVDLSSNPTETLALLEESIPKLQSSQSLHAAYLDLARVDELLGDLEGAQVAFQNASLVPGPKDYRSLLASANALLQLGRTDEASAQARVIVETCQDPLILIRAKVLLARTMAASGAAAKARPVIEGLLANEASSPLSPSELFQLHQASFDLGFSDLATETARLLARYPKSPEYLILTGRAAQYPSPSIMLGYRDLPYLGPPGGAPKPTASAESSDPGSIMIQIGSYLDRTNAEYRVRDLEQAGFPGEIVEARIDGTSYYRVVVPNVPAARSQNELIRLKEKGFEGFFLFN